MITNLRQIFLSNELGGDDSLIYKFSYAGGKSGYSFGLCQLDVSHSKAAVNCLRECGFTNKEIDDIKNRLIAPSTFDSKLNHKVVDKYDNEQIQTCLSHTSHLCSEYGIKISERASYHLADYHNQFFMSRNGKMHTFLKSLNRLVVPNDILRFKLSTLWGKKRPDDVHRRYNNIERVLG